MVVVAVAVVVVVVVWLLWLLWLLWSLFWTKINEANCQCQHVCYGLIE